MVEISAPQVARTITVGSRVITTDRIFVVVPMTVAKPLPGYQRLMAKLTNADRSYPAWSAFGPPIAPPGFRARFGMFPQLGAPVGFIAANGLFLALGAVLTPAPTSSRQATTYGTRRKP